MNNDGPSVTPHLIKTPDNLNSSAELLQPQRSTDVEVYCRISEACNRDHSLCTHIKQLYIKFTQQRLSAKTHSWEKAEAKARELEKNFIIQLDPVLSENKRLRQKEALKEEGALIPVSFALQEWIDELEDTILPKDPLTGECKPATLEPYLTHQRHFGAYCIKNRVLTLGQITPDVAREFRKTWKEHKKKPAVKVNAREKKQMKFTHFLDYCVRRDWLEKNFLAGGKKSKVGLPGGVPWEQMVAFSDEDMATIYRACDKLGRGEHKQSGQRIRDKMRALIDLMVDSGMAIKDSVTLNPELQLDDDGEIEERNRAKTGNAYYTGVTPKTAERVRAVEAGVRDDKKHPFRGSACKPENYTKRYYNQFKKLWKLCDPPLVLKGGRKPKPHMFRATFAVRYLRKHLEAGIYPLSKILGTSVEIIQKHYVPMVPELQEIIRAHRRAAFNQPPAPEPQSEKVVEIGEVRRRAGGRKA